MSKQLFSIIALVLAALACNWSDIAPAAVPEIEPSQLPTFAISTLTAVPTETLLPSPSATPDAPIAWPKELGVNCRYGPGKEWEAVSSLPVGSRTEIAGRTIDSSWWYVSDPLNIDGVCWVAFEVVDTAGNMNIIPIVEPPVAAVTNVTVDAVVTFTSCGVDNQVTFNGTITANGPIMITYHWEVSGDAQIVTSGETITFIESGTKKLKYDTFSANCGDYTAELLVTNPNETAAEKTFKIQAP